MKSRRRSPLQVTWPLAVLLSGCAAHDATYARAGHAPDATAFQADTAECSRVGSSQSGLFESAIAGAGDGAHDASRSAGNSLERLGGVVGGAVVGFFVGAFSSGPGDNFDLCMARKGYQRIDPQTAEAAP